MRLMMIIVFLQIEISNLNEIIESEITPIFIGEEEISHQVGIFKCSKNKLGIKRSKHWIGYFCLIDCERQNAIQSSLFIELEDEFRVPLAFLPGKCLKVYAYLTKILLMKFYKHFKNHCYPTSLALRKMPSYLVYWFRKIQNFVSIFGSKSMQMTATFYYHKVFQNPWNILFSKAWLKIILWLPLDAAAIVLEWLPHQDIYFEVSNKS